MGIEKKEFYVIQCDFCGEEVENEEGGTLCLDSKEAAIEYITLVGWREKNGKIECEECWESL